MNKIPLLLLLWVAGAAAQVSALQSAPVELREVDLSYPAEALVEAVQRATVAAQVQGRIVEVLRDAGEHVTRGEVLLRIDEREAAQAYAGSEARVAEAQAAAANARAQYQRSRDLRAKNFVSDAALDQALAADRQAQASLQLALAAKGQAATARSFVTVTAPISGVIAARHAELGEMATPGKPLITLFDPAALRVIASLPQFQRAALVEPARAVIEFPETGRRVAASRVEVMPTLDAQTHSLQLRLYLPVSSSDILPGMYARAHIAVGRAAKLVVPAVAIVRRGELTAVYVVAGERLSLRQVRLGEYSDGTVTEVLAGVAAGERVALDPLRATIEAVGAAAK